MEDELYCFRWIKGGDNLRVVSRQLRNEVREEERHELKAVDLATEI